VNKLALLPCLLAISYSGAQAATTVRTGPSQGATAQSGAFQVAQVSEKEAFESAKELGTIEAWEAFLSNYPTGFHADLARAYVKRLGAPSQPQAGPPPTPSVAPIMRPSIGRLALAPSQKEVRDQPNAARLTCSQRSGLSTLESVSPARISFINYSKKPFDVYWIDQNGQTQLFGQINPQRQAAVETFVTQPWMVADLSGTCIAIAIPNPGPQVFVVGAPDEASEPEKKVTKKKGCGSGKIVVDGKCMSKSQSVGYCGPGYTASGGTCVPRQQAAPQRPKCPPGQVWSPQELCHYDD
jgi:VHL beta domain